MQEAVSSTITPSSMQSGRHLRERTTKKRRAGMFIFQTTFMGRQSGEIPYSLVEKDLKMSAAARDLLKAVLEGKKKSTDLYFGADSKSEQRRDSNFEVLTSTLSGCGISCRRDTVTDLSSGITYFILSISNDYAGKPVSSGKGRESTGQQPGAFRARAPRPLAPSGPTDTFQPAIPDRTSSAVSPGRKALGKYGSLMHIYGQEYVSQVVSAAREYNVNALTIFLIMNAEHTNYRQGKASTEFMLLASKIKQGRFAGANVRDSPTKGGAGHSYAFAQMQEGTFDMLKNAGLLKKGSEGGFTFDEMRHDWRKCLRATAAYVAYYEGTANALNSGKAPHKHSIGISSYSDPLLLAVSYINPYEAQRAVAKYGKDNWQEHYKRQMGHKDENARGLGVYYAKVEGGSEVMGLFV